MIKPIAFTKNARLLVWSLNQTNCYVSRSTANMLQTTSSKLPEFHEKKISSLCTSTSISKYSTSFNNNNNKLSNDASSPADRDPMKKPTLEQLVMMEEKMKQHLPKFLKETHPYALYTNDMTFENLYFDPPKTTIGVLAYAIELLKLRWKINIKFSNASVQLLKVTNDEDDSTVKIRWRLRGVRGMKIFTPWKLKVWNLKESIKRESEWHDGFSILYVRGDGRIYKHTMQRVIANKDETVEDEKKEEKLKKLLKKNVNIGTTM